MAGPLRVLILEDNPADAELVQFELQEGELAFTAKIVMTEEDFIRELQEFSPDLILSDYDLPKYNGALALAETRRKRPDTPFILVTGAVTEDRAIDILTQGAKDYVLKNRLQQRLVPAVRRALAEAEEQRARRNAEAELREAHRTLEERVKNRTAELEAEMAARKRLEEERERLLAEAENRAAELRVSEERFSKAFKNSPNAITITRISDGKIIEGNDSVYDLLGYNQDEVVGKTTFDLGIWANADERVKLTNGLATKGLVKNQEFTLLRKDRTPVIVDLSASLINIDNQQCFLTSFIDITKRKKTEEALKESEKKYRELVKHAPTGIYEIDFLNRKFVTVNDAMVLLSGYKREELLAIDPLDILHDESKKAFTARISEMFKGGKPDENVEYKVIAKDGHIIDAILNMSFKFDEQGKPIGAMVIGHDVTERKRAEEALQESEEQFRVLTQNLVSAVALINERGEIAIVNQSFRRLFDLPEDADILNINSRDWGQWQVFDETGQLLDVDEHPVRKAARTRRGVRDALVALQCPERKERKWVLISAEPILDAQGDLNRLICTYHDITARRRAEEALRESEERIQQALCVSHSFTFEWELDTDRVRRSESCATMLGLTGDEAVNDTGQNYFQRVHPDDRARFVAMLDRLTPANASYTAEYRVVRGDGHVVVFEETGAATFDAAGKLARLAGVTTDITARKQAEVELARTKTLLETLLTQAPVGFAYFDRELRYVLINDQLAEVNGLPVAAHIGKTVGETLPTLLPAVQHVTSQILATGQPVRDHEFNGETAAQPGVTRYWNESWYPVCDAAGEIVGFGAVVEETTARKRAEEALRESEDRLRRIAQDGRIGIFEWNAATDAAYWSREHYELFGMAPGTPISWERWRQGVHPDDRERVEQNAARMLEQGRAQGQVRNHTDEYRYRRPDGTEIWLESNVSLDMVGNEAIIRGSVRDVTDRKQAEDALRASEARFRLTLKNSPVLVTLQDTNLVYQWVFNTRTRRPEEVVGKTDADLFAPDEAAALSAAKSQVLETGTEVRETFWLTSNGQRVFLDCYYEPVRDAAGKIIGVGGASVDLTEQKQAEEALTERTRQLDDANEELDSFAYSVSHDLRAPLRAIDGFARMILKQQGDKFDEKTRNQFDVIIKNTKMMGQLIEDLLALSRLGREAISMSKLNIEDLARDVWKELNAINPDRPVDLKIDHAPPATGDRSFIKQVLVNLLSNAIKFTRIREVPLIEVGGYDGKAENVYYVRDNGVGFDMQYLDKLFGVFQRLHSTNEYEGTGIGLALVQRIIHRHGGRVWAEAEVGKGATFYFTLPTG